MSNFKTGDQVEVKMCINDWHRATYIATNPDNGKHILCLNDSDSLGYQTCGDIHCSLYDEDRVRKFRFHERRKNHCCCNCPRC